MRLGAECALAQHPHRHAVVLRAIARLAHGSHDPPLQGERRGVDEGLVAEADAAHPGVPPRAEACFVNADRGRSPALFVAAREELAHRVVGRGRLTELVSTDKGDPSEDAKRHGTPAALVKDVRTVAAKRERVQSAAVRARDQLGDSHPLTELPPPVP